MNLRKNNLLCDNLFCLTGEIKIFFLQKIIPPIGWDWNIIIFIIFEKEYSA